MGQQAKLRGVFTAMVTPFKEDYTLDIEGFRNNLEAQLKAGITPVVLGTTGEAPQVTGTEREYLVKTAVSQSKQYNRSVVVGVTSENYEEMMKMAEKAETYGADYILATPTPYVKQQQHDIVSMYKDLSEIGLPIIVYNIQSRIGVNIETPTLRKIAELENVVAVKEASGNLDQMKTVIDAVVRDRPEFSVLSGDDNMTYKLLEIGGDGVVSVVTNLVPEMVVGMVSSYLSGDVERAKTLDEKLQPLYKAAFLEGNPKSIKGLMREAGMPAGPTRPPLYYLKPETVERLREVLSIYELVPVK